jgi:hypothetical protein
MFLIYAHMAIHFPLRTAFVVSHKGRWCFHFHQLLSYFFYDLLIIEQCVIQSPIICIFSAVAFVVEF